MNKLLAILNVLGLGIVLFMNFFSQSDFFPYTVGELGESRAIFFLPAGYVFAIWGLIYLGQIAFAVYQFRNEQARQLLSWYFLLSCAANSVWLVLFLYNLIWESTIAMLVLLFSLLMMYTRLQNARKTAGNQEKWFLHYPFSIYLGWITVATVANFTAALHDLGFVTSMLGISADYWAVIMLLVAAGFGAAFIFLRQDYPYALVLVWAFVGIYARPFNSPAFAPLADLNIALVQNAALACAALLGFAMLLQIGRNLLKSNSKLEVSAA